MIDFYFFEQNYFFSQHKDEESKDWRRKHNHSYKKLFRLKKETKAIKDYLEILKNT